MVFVRSRHSGPDFHRDKLQPESRIPGKNRDPVIDMVPDFRRDDVLDAPVSGTGQAPQVRHDGITDFINRF